MAFQHFLIIFFPFPNVQSFHKTHRQGKGWFAMYTRTLNGQHPNSANSGLPHHTPPCHQETLSNVPCYCPVAGFCWFLSWNYSMEAKSESPNPEELSCFLVSLQIASRKFVLEKKPSAGTQTLQWFQPGLSAIYCIKLRLHLVSSRQGNLCEDWFLFCWDKLIQGWSAASRI